MKNHCYVVLSAAVAMSAGCGSGSQAGAPPTVAATTVRSEAVPATKRTDLLYISDVGKNAVYVFSYPRGSLLRTLSGFSSPVSECSDTAGNVYITNTNAENILEYAHGGSNPITTYTDKHFLPVDCAVDPTSGKLVVANYGPNGTNRGNLAFFSAGKTTPKFYEDRSIRAYVSCTYDNTGDLFVAGLNSVYDFALIELPKGAKKFVRIKLNQNFSSRVGVRWDGKHVAISDGASTVYDFAVAGTKARLINTIQLQKAVNVVQFWINGSTLIGPDGPNGGHQDAGFWKYPDGGAPQKTVGGGLFENPSAATISRAQ